MTRIAVISDIHGNMEAIEAVFADIENRNCEKIFVLGDYAMAGPEPVSAVKFFMDKLNDKKYTMIQGNTDLMIADYNENLYLNLKDKAPIMAEALKNDANLLNNEQKNFLKNLPAQTEIKVEEVKFLLTHGSPRRNNEDILPDTPIEEVENMISEVESDVILCGHTHLPCGFQTRNKKTVVNAGSIGRPFTQVPDSCYLTIDVNQEKTVFEHHFIKYNKEKASEKLERRNFSGADKLAGMLINPTVRHF